MAVPYLIYFYEKYQSPYPEGMTKLELEEKLLRKMIDYHYAYGATGFLSERSSLQGIFAKIDMITEKEWNIYQNQPKWQMGKLAVEGPDHEAKAKKDLEEALGENFGGWYVPGADFRLTPA